ncbi:MAG: phosphoribosylamine--glycine ligase [Cyanobacteria bacterium RI_101]|nr:phosphoribosylamine--glycine ligase [Cyanobacteria bacterium RI_101]
MKVAVIGNGGREHALAWKLTQSPAVSHCYCLPGNGGAAALAKAENVPLAVEDLAGISQFCQAQGVDLVVVGPELPLSLGLADHLRDLGLKVFGPSQVGAQLEASKSWAKALMERAGVPTAQGETFSDLESALAYLARQTAPIVVKADGLAAGKGVIVAQTLLEAETALKDLFAQGFNPVVVEEFLAGEEVSVLALADGQTVIPLLPAQDHKRIGEGDTGPNTGGMGVYAPAPIAPAERMAEITRTILEPTLGQLRAEGIDYRGVLYAGLMVSPQGEIKVLEYNCRFGDPETQAILPLLADDLAEILLAAAEGRLQTLPPLTWKPASAVCVVMAAQGYPGAYAKGETITGIEAAEAQGLVVFQAGTRFTNQGLVTDGGRVLGVTALGDSLESAVVRVYQNIDQIRFNGAYYRRDIAHRALRRG